MSVTASFAREADIVELLRDKGPLTSRQIAVELFGTPEGSTKPARSHVARVTQSVRNLERDGLVQRVDASTLQNYWGLKEQSSGQVGRP